MLRPRTAWILAVALAAACLSSPPVKADPKAYDIDHTGKVGGSSVDPYGDSDQYNHMPVTHSISVPVGGMAPGHLPGTGYGNRLPAGSRPVGGQSPSQLLWLVRSLAKAFLGITAQ